MCLILVVEDEALTALDLVELLEERGYDVVGPANSGAEAMELAEARRPDLVLMDIMLSGAMDGIEAAGAIKARRSVPVIFLSANGDLGTRRRAAAVDPSGFLYKPFHPAQLVDSIAHVLAA